MAATRSRRSASRFTRAPDTSAEAITGLAQMYVADERFAANYGGAEGAGYVRDALVLFAQSM